MGQAKSRGTKEQREAEAKKRRLEQLNISERPIEEIYKEFDLPDDSEFLGYIINIVESDEFVAKFEDTPDQTNIAYAKIPDLGLRFEDFSEALDVAKKVAEKYKTVVFKILCHSPKLCKKQGMTPCKTLTLTKP